MANTYSVTKLKNSVHDILECDVNSVLDIDKWHNDTWLEDSRVNLEHLKSVLRPVPDLPLLLLPEEAVEELTDILKNVADALNELKQQCFETIGDWMSPQDYFVNIHNSAENIYSSLATHLSHLALVDEKSLSTVNKILSTR